MIFNTVAHLKWFESSDTVSITRASAQELIFVILFVIGGLLILRFIEQKTKKVNKLVDDKLKFALPFVPSLISIAIGLTLILMSLKGQLFTPNILSDDLTYFVDKSQLLVYFTGVLLLFGLFTRFASIALALLFIFVSFNSSENKFEHLEYLGAAFYLLVMPTGKLSIDQLFGWSKSMFKKYSHLGLPVLRILTGFSLAFLAFSEKLFNIELAQTFLQSYHWNLVGWLGVSDHNFVIIAGSIELLLGLAIMLNIAPRLAVLALASVMTLTAILLGPTEVIGHLFALSFAIAILVGPQKSLKFRR